MFKGLYTKLAFTNMKNNKRFYLPYLITAIVTVAMFYIMCSIAWNKNFLEVPDGKSLKIMLHLGCYVVGITAVIFLFYTNSFLMKRRKRELGIYNILGMEKKHISKVLLLETLCLMTTAIFSGLLVGILFDKLMIMLLFKMIGSSIPFVFEINTKAILASLALFVCIFFSTLIYNLLQVKLTNPINLLHGTSTGEREPKTKLLMTLIGICCVGYGYYISATTVNPLAALNLFFVAVLLVIVGTYCLFTSGSIALLKLLRKNKRYYYKTNHFTAVSGMLYRMKQNAVGLSNICILSTMVLVILSTTFCLYIGINEELESRFPYELSVYGNYEGLMENREEIEKSLTQLIEEAHEITFSNSSFVYTTFAAYEDGEWKTEEVDLYAGDAVQLVFLTAADYRKQPDALLDAELTKTMENLTENEVIVYGSDLALPKTIQFQSLALAVKEQRVAEEAPFRWKSAFFDNAFYVIVKDEQSLKNIYDSQEGAAADVEDLHHVSLMYELDFNVDAGKEEKLALADRIQSQCSSLPKDATRLFVESREQNRESFQGMYGTFFFLGIFFGSLFLMITVLIIFYKQISEGFEDKERFAIMQKVGMSKKEVRRSIRSQIQIVFFLPLVTAAVHVFAAFPMIKRLLVVLNLTNDTLFAYCLIGTILVFGVSYFIVFMCTSRTYYRILGET